MIRIALISLLLLAACATQGPDVAAPFSPDYLGVKTSLLDGNLVRFRVSMTGARDNRDVEAYAECAAAQYALIRGYGFARHVRTKIEERGGVWVADAVFIISPSLPRGLRIIDAEVVVAACVENAIPTV